ncbi:fimbrillin-like protein [Dysgonomonas alginatilytica]|uniref:Fimbrillin-like protein n=2 Tax=Dysgonomonas alginatilytica TaxID=1605892 RepID=A0A2V3PIL0_9BACT|nr:fimbrillin-like protein [Dysgonomonas alginatilytica]
MKKMMTLAAMAALVLTGCSNDTEGISETANPAKLIAFRTVSDKTETYATPMDINNMSSFTMNASYEDLVTSTSGFNFMNYTSVTKTKEGSTAWAYAPQKYYPMDGSFVYFYAYSPAGSVNAESMVASGSPAGISATLKYIVPLRYSTSGKNPEDFLVASTKQNGGAVVLSFQHALSMATFKARNTSTAATFIVKSIQLIHLENTGTLDLEPTGPAATTQTWTNNTTLDKTYQVSLPEAGVPLIPNPAQPILNLTSENEGLMIMPQTLGTYAGGTGIIDSGSGQPNDINTKTYIKVSYNVVDADFKSTVAIKYLPMPTGFTFVQGKKYQFVLSFGNEIGNPVSFSVNMTTWSAITDTTIN